EPSVEDTIAILKGLEKQYSEFHSVTYTEPAIVAAANLSSKYLHDRRLPDKAIDLLDEAGAGAKLQGRTVVDVAEVETVLARMAQIPPREVSSDDRESLRNLEGDMRKVV